MSEQLIYEDGKIRITSNIFSNGRGEQFVIPSIRDISEDHKSKPVWSLILGLILLGLSAWQEFFPDSRLYMGGAGVLFILWYITSRERHTIRLITAAGEVDAFTTKDDTQFKNVMTCLKRAWSMHKG